jgi:hypothetical protein
MQAYKVIGRAHRRVNMLKQPGFLPDGTRIEVTQAGPMTTYAVGDIIEDIQRDELVAFPDRFVPATSAEVDAWHEKQAQLPTVMRAPGLSAEQALEHAELTRQIEALQAKQQELLTQATTPVETTLEPQVSPPPPGRSSEGAPGSPPADAPGHRSVAGGTTPAAVAETPEEPTPRPGTRRS